MARKLYQCSQDYPVIQGNFVRLRVGQLVREGDYMNAKSNPVDRGWVKATVNLWKVKKTDGLYYYRKVKE